MSVKSVSPDPFDSSKFNLVLELDVNRDIILEPTKPFSKEDLLSLKRLIYERHPPRTTSIMMMRSVDDPACTCGPHLCAHCADGLKTWASEEDPPVMIDQRAKG